MSQYSAIKAAVNAYIKANGRKEITGNILNAVLNATISSLGKFYQFAGVALPSTDPEDPDQNVCYLAGEPGTYVHFDNIVLENEEIALLFWNGEWTKQRMLLGIQEVEATVDNQVGTPSVDVSYSAGRLVLTFHNLKGDPGDTGDAAGFGTIGADITGGVGTPGVTVESSGSDTAKNLMFHFTNLKGETGVTSVIATVDNTTGTPQCSVSLAGGVLTLAFTGLKGLQGDTGVSADYPITIVNNLSTNDPTSALSAAMGVQLESEVSGIPPLTYNGYINNGVWKDLSSPARKHKAIPIPSELVGTVLEIQSSTNRTDLVFLSSYSPEEGQNTGIIETHIYLPNAYVSQFVIPASATYIYLLWESGTSRIPAVFRIAGINYLVKVKDNIADLALKGTNAEENISGVITSIYGKENPMLSWKRGNISNNGFEDPTYPVNYRVMTDNILYTAQALHITSKTGYKFNIHKYDAKGASLGWYATYKTDQTVDAGFYIRIIIIKDTEDTSTPADIATFVGNINIENQIGTIKNEIEEIQADLLDTQLLSTFISKKEFLGYINGSNWADIGTGSRTYKIADITGREELIIKGNSSAQSVYAFLSEYTPVNGTNTGIIGSATGVGLGEEKKVAIPNNAKYLYLLWTSGSSRTPQTLLIDGVDYLDSIKDVITDLSKEGGEFSNNFGDIYGDTNFDWRSGSLNNSTGEIDSQYNYRITSFNIIEAKRDIDLSVDNGYRFIIGTYSSAGVWNGYSGSWSTSKTITKGVFFRVMIQQYPEDTSTPADIETFSSAFHYVSLVDIVTGLAPQPNTILSLNPEDEVIPKIANLKRRYISYGGSDTEYPPVLVLAHYSDIHADNDNILRIKQFTDKYSSYIDDVLQTGDLIGGSFVDGMPTAYAQTTDTINVIGNHDSMNYVGGNWELVGKKDVYDEVLSPYISGWGVTQPTGAAENGYCYFYKDYSDNGVRLVVLDCLHWDSTQKSWFEGILADSITDELDVIVAVHFPPFYIDQDQDNPFAAIDTASNSVNFTNVEAANAVKTFINNGGNFVCWLCGHIHQDVMGLGRTVDGFQNQLAISIATASVTPAGIYSEMARVQGTRTQDCFNIVGIDTHSKTIKVMRIGANYDRYMRRKNTFSWNYATGQIIYVD